LRVIVLRAASSQRPAPAWRAKAGGGTEAMMILPSCLRGGSDEEIQPGAGLFSIASLRWHRAGGALTAVGTGKEGDGPRAAVDGAGVVERRLTW
jgi:hypothetical protein